MTTAERHDLTGAYALQALEDDERAAFERHLARCEACGQEVAEFTATAARLALACSVPARPALRERVLDRITGVRQVAPVVAPVRRARGRSPWGGGPAGRAGWSPRGGGAARWALAASVAAALFGGVAVWQYERAQDAREQVARARRGGDDLAGVLAAPDARSRSARVAGGTATVVVSAGRDRAVFLASRMDPPPRGKVYQLWFADGGTMRSAGLVDPGRGSQAVLMSGEVGEASGVGVTVEPAGGSPRPTSAPLALLAVPS
ncbi:anti-sigma factor domain-containing protein [Streptomyces sp. NPDC048362]|uniref:anti-sigma factor n=1 Tax=Streptomyces sp. NPDC048362 TaxID=3365539 RepID=UPI003717E804